MAIARIDNDSNYESFRKGWKICPVVRDLLEETGIDSSSDAGVTELARFQDYFHEYKIVVYRGLSYNNMLFEVLVESTKNLNLL